jgi:predicted dehydrogenase
MNNTTSITRRQFLKTSAATLALGAAYTGSSLRVLGANERIRLGFIGLGGRGFFHLRQFQQMEDVSVVAAAEVAQEKLDRAKALQPGLSTFQDYRALLDLKDLDAVVISTPDHWHAIPTIQACQAGKDVYVEKPLGHNIREGRAMVQAARKYNRVVQLGTQQRSGPTWIEAINRIKSGEFGKISLVRTWNCWGLETRHADIGSPPDSEPPAGVDYDQWLGPAPKRPFNPGHFDFTFYYHWAYSGGMISAWGVHLFDVVTWAMGPTVNAVTTIGGKFVTKDSRDTPDTAAVTFECPGYLWTYELRHGNGKDPWGHMDHGIEFYGTKACLWINREGYTVFQEDARPEALRVRDVGQDTQHERNWLDCIRSRQRPNADVELGHLGSVPAHLSNIAYRVGRRIRWDGGKETIPGDSEAVALLGRAYRKPYVLPKV